MCVYIYIYRYLSWLNSWTTNPTIAMFRSGVSATDHLLAFVVCSKVLKTREEFVNTANLGAVDILAVRLWLDRKVRLLFYGCLQL